MDELVDIEGFREHRLLACMSHSLWRTANADDYPT
jgi:hypothetical protein